MGAVLSSAAAVVDAARATKNYARRRLLSAHEAAAVADWSGLPDDLLFSIMAALEIQSLRRSGAVCTSWRRAHDAFRIPALEKTPCLLYACEEHGPNDVALYCPTTEATFRVPFPGPPHDKRGFTFSCPGGWVFTTDEAGDPYLTNPLTGVRAALPPVKTIYGNDTYFDDGGKHATDHGIVTWARHEEYLRVAISAAAEVTECTVLIAHQPRGRLSFARPGDKRWTLLSQSSYVRNILYNEQDGLFYVVYGRGSVSTLDLRGPSPSTATIMPRVMNEHGLCDIYLVLGPSGELLQVWRNRRRANTPRMDRDTYKRIVNGSCQDRVDFAGEDADNNKLSELETIEEEEDELYEAITAGQVTDVLRAVIDLPYRIADEVTTNELLVFKVDTERQKLVELRDIGDHALFLGRNSAVCLPTKDIPALEPNCAYLTDDYFACSPMLRKDLGIWNIKKRSLQKLGDAWPNLHPWLHLPAPVWIMPKF